MVIRCYKCETESSRVLYYCHRCCQNDADDQKKALRERLESTFETQLEKETKEFQSSLTCQQNKTNELQSKLDFLRLQLDYENADGIFKPDVAISVDDSNEDITLYAHKFILASRSPVFCKMLQTNMLERETGVIRINDATLPVMRGVIEFCYTGEIAFTNEVTSEEVLQVAQKYDIGLLVRTCEEKLIETMDGVNLPRRLKLAKKFEVKRLHRAALEYLKTHYDDLIDPVLKFFSEEPYFMV